MKAFQFPLEKVLAFRKRQWEAEAAILESLIANRAHLEAQRLRMLAAADEAVREIAGAASVSSAGLAEFRFAQASSREAAKQLERALSSLRNKIAAQQKAFLHARRNYELVLRLREKRYAEWLREANRQEEADATESYLGRFTQRRFALNSRTPVRLASPGEIPLPSEEPAGVR